MKFKNCPYYQKLIHLISTSGQFENFECKSGDVQHCESCTDSYGICKFWISIMLVNNKGPITRNGNTQIAIETLEDNFILSVCKIIAGLQKHQE